MTYGFWVLTIGGSITKLRFKVSNIFNVHADFSCKVTELALKIVGVSFTAPPHGIEIPCDTLC